MDREAQQRILGFFIEEARDHMVNLEQGLLSLQDRATETELINDMFRAAHSIKGGAAMLGISSIQLTAHRIEDTFGIFRERTVVVDSKLETLLLRCYDTLAMLLDKVQRPEGLPTEEGDAALAEIEPVFEQLDLHMKVLLGEISPEAAEAAVSAPTSAPLAPSMQDTFQQYVPRQMREMLDLFRQGDSLETRSGLKDLVASLKQLGTTYELPKWSQLLQTIGDSLDNSQVSLNALAHQLLPAIKNSQTLVLEGNAEAIAAPRELLSLLDPVIPGTAISENVTEDNDSDVTSQSTGDLDELVKAAAALAGLLDEDEAEIAIATPPLGEMIEDPEMFDTLATVEAPVPSDLSEAAGKLSDLFGDEWSEDANATDTEDAESESFDTSLGTLFSSVEEAENTIVGQTDSVAKGVSEASERVDESFALDSTSALADLFETEDSENTVEEAVAFSNQPEYVAAPTGVDNILDETAANLTDEVESGLADLFETEAIDSAPSAPFAETVTVSGLDEAEVTESSDTSLADLLELGQENALGKDHEAEITDETSLDDAAALGQQSFATLEDSAALVGEPEATTTPPAQDFAELEEMLGVENRCCCIPS